LSRLAGRINGELHGEYAAVSPLHVRWLRRAAQLEALSEMTIERIGVDPKCTRRAATALQARADAILARVPVRERRGMDPLDGVLASLKQGR
jgi:hypothetical protein